VSDRSYTAPPAAGFGGLRPLAAFLNEFFPMKNGKPRSLRNQQDFVRRYGLRVIRRGYQAYVDEELEAQRLRDALRNAETARRPRGPGRPRKPAG
jgi:hypothetical protein